MKKTALVIGIIIVITAYLGIFKVNEYQIGVVLRFEKPVREINNPGLHFKIPFIDRFESYDARVLSYDSDPREVYTQDKKNLVIDNYAKWRIVKPKLFLEKVRNERGAQVILDATVYSELRQSIGKYTLTEIVGLKRQQIMDEVVKRCDDQLDKIGVKVIDVRIKRVDLPQENEENVYARMRAEREQQAAKYRFEGKAESQKIKSRADRTKSEIESKANRKAKEIRGEGDAKALQIYADAFNQSKEFFKFVRTLEAYEKIFSGDAKNTLILSAEGETWKMLQENKKVEDLFSEKK